MLIVIGDEIRDVYIEHRTIGHCAECPVVSEEQTEQPGGAAAVYAMVRALGADCLLLGNSRCHRRRSVKTRVYRDGKLQWRIDDDETESFSADVVKLIAGVRVQPSVVLISSYGKGAIDRSVVLACLERGWRVVADPHRSDAPSIYAGVWAIKCNADEDRDQVYSRGGGRVCVTQGAAGMVPYENGEPKYVGRNCIVDQRDVVDATGAGDQVLATIGVMLEAGNDWLASCEAGNVAAGIKCGKRGTTPVTADELAAAMRPSNV